MNAQKQDSQLRAKFNPDGSQLRMHQLRMLDMLTWLDDFCKKHEIRYWLAGGTCLGAVRHKGFIPWDDDVDIDMLREDYNKFIKNFRETEDLVLQTNITDPYYVVPYAKLRDKKSWIQEHGLQDKNYKYKGIYIDIIVFENCSQRLASFCGKLAWKILIYGSKVEKGKIKFAIYKLAKYGYLSLLKAIRTFDFLLPNKKLIPTYGSGFENISIREHDIFPLTQIEFEGKLFPCPHNYDQYLKDEYGDYLKLPDLDKIQSHTSKIKLNNSIF